LLRGSTPDYYYGLAASRMGAPGENHILIRIQLRNVSYAANQVNYSPADGNGTEYLRLRFTQ